MIQQLVDQISRFLYWVVVVAPWEQGIRIRLGKHIKLLGAGAHLVIPVIDRVYRQSCRRRLTVLRPMTLSTKDGRTVTISGYVGYAINDLLKLYNTISHAEDTIEAEVSTLVSSYISNNNFDDCKVPRIEDYVKSKMDIDRYGLSGSTFFISNFAVVKTYRFITGEVNSWLRSNTALDTDRMQNSNGTYVN